MFSTEDLNLFQEEFGGEIPVKLSGVPVKTIKGISQFEVITTSPNEAEIGSFVLTLQIAKSDYDLLDKAKKYSFTIDGIDYIPRGPAEQDGTGFVKLQMKKA